MKLKQIIVLLLFAASGISAFAQSVAGLAGLTGTVRDASGGAVPGAKVVLSNDAKGIRRTMESTAAGVFAAPSLPPSPGYSLTVTKDGFAGWEVKDFELLVGHTQDFVVTLTVASTSTTVEVTAEASLVSSTDTGVGQAFETSQLDNLPINSRRADIHALAAPGVVPDGTFGLLGFRGLGAANSFLTDGNNTTNSFYLENAGRTRISTQISQDAVQEFQVLTEGYSAEFGKAMGGVINTVTRSGTNDIHGTGYWFFRNRTIEATDRYSPAGLNPPEWRHTAGAAIGGPLKKDKVFYFGNFELIRRNFPGVNRIINPAFTDSTGSFIPTSSCGTATPAQCTAAINFVQKQMGVLVPRTVSSIMGFGKIDWRPTERNSFTVQLNAMHWRSPHGIQTQSVLASGNMLGNNGNSTVETRYGKASWTSIPTSSSVNELRFGWFKDRLSDPAASDLWPKETGGLYITLPGTTTVGAAQAYPRTYPSENRYQIVENYGWTHGAHSAKFGMDFNTNLDYLNQLFNGNGSYAYATFAAFALDFTGNTPGLKNWQTFSQQFGIPTRTERMTDTSFYAQDTWKLNRRLTLNYGLRYEKTWLPQPAIVNPNYPQTGKIPSPNKDFAPRLSLSYAVNDKTVLRAGYGIFYSPFIGNGLDVLILGNGMYQTSISIQPTQAGAPVFPNILPSAQGLPSGVVNLQFASPNFHNPYVQQGNVTLEHQFSPSIAFEASYLWSHALSLWTQRDMNLGPLGPTVTYAIDDSTGKQVSSYSTQVYTSKVDPRYNQILQVENGGQAWYNGLVVQVRKRMAHGFSASVSYTWSHAIDDAYEQGGSNTIAWGSLRTVYNGNYRFDKGTSGLDQRHRVGVVLLWAPTLTHSTSAAARYLMNGWQLSTITTMASSVPTSPTISVSGAQFPGVSFAQNTTLNGEGGWTRVPFLPVDSIDVDRAYRVDARLSRTLPFSERVKGTLLFEGFNVCNTQFNTGVSTQAYTATAGVLRPTPGLGFGNASQFFLDGTNARRMQVGLRVTF